MCIIKEYSKKRSSEEYRSTTCTERSRPVKGFQEVCVKTPNQLHGDEAVPYACVKGERGRAFLGASTGVVPRIASVRPRDDRRFFIYFVPAGTAKGLSGRPLETFGSLRLEGRAARPSQSPAATALPEGEPRQYSLGHGSSIHHSSFLIHHSL